MLTRGALRMSDEMGAAALVITPAGVLMPLDRPALPTTCAVPTGWTPRMIGGVPESETLVDSLVDAGPVIDAGPVMIDAGPVMIDAGTVMIDAGTVMIDAPAAVVIDRLSIPFAETPGGPSYDGLVQQRQMTNCEPDDPQTDEPEGARNRMPRDDAEYTGRTAPATRYGRKLEDTNATSAPGSTSPGPAQPAGPAGPAGPAEPADGDNGRSKAPAFLLPSPAVTSLSEGMDLSEATGFLEETVFSTVGF